MLIPYNRKHFEEDQSETSESSIFPKLKDILNFYEQQRYDILKVSINIGNVTFSEVYNLTFPQMCL